ncbi:hypothetical protein BDV59DRAFT_180704 [Aspergillus ambiguus]|uniref:uncharacterized protein n=1 Tax=Aspergillus ambiguus TaxID=176160 RepID=UPI003CCDCADF
MTSESVSLESPAHKARRLSIHAIGQSVREIPLAQYWQQDLQYPPIEVLSIPIDLTGVPEFSSCFFHPFDQPFPS